MITTSIVACCLGCACPVYNLICFSRDLTHASLSVTARAFVSSDSLRWVLTRHTHSLASLLTSFSLLPNA